MSPPDTLESNRSLPPRKNYRPNVILITSVRCNYRCRMCYWSNPESARAMKKEDPVMSMELFTRLLDEVAPHCGSISLTASGEFMADPLYKARLEKLGECLRKNPSLRYIQITNGSLLNTEDLKSLAGAGEVRFSISLDSTDYLEYASIRRPGSLSVVRDNLLRLRETLSGIGVERISFRLNVALMKRNVFSLPDVIRLAHEIGATVYVDHVFRFGTIDIQDESLFSFPAFANSFLDRCIKLAEQLRVPLDHPPPFLLEPPEQESATNEELQRECYQLEENGPIQIEANGNVVACCQPLYVGNVFQQSFEEIVFGPTVDRYREAIAAGSPLPPCSGCRFLTRRSPYLYDSAEYGWDIPPESRNCDVHPDFAANGFFDWIDEFSQARLRRQIRNHYERRAESIFEENFLASEEATSLGRAAFANEILLDVIRKNERAIVYGAGVDSQWLMTHTLLKHVDIIAFADRDTRKQKGTHFGAAVVAPADIGALDPDVVLIANEQHQDSIVESLRDIFGAAMNIRPLF